MIQLYYMDYVTTNIRLYQEDYQRLKLEAAKTRQSLSAIIREKLSGQKKSRSFSEVERLLARTEKLAEQNAKYLKGVYGTKTIREMRDNAKW